MNILSCDISLDRNQRQLGSENTKGFPILVYSHQFKGKPIEYHWHTEVEIITVISGRLEVVVEMKEVILNEGESIYINSGMLHSCTSYDNTDCIIRSFVFKSEFIHGDIDSLLYKKYFYALFSGRGASFVLLKNKFNNVLLNIYDRFIKDEFAFEFKIREELTEVLLYVARENECNTQTYEEKKVRLINRCKSMLLFIHRNYGEDISLENIAESANIKESECLRCFRSVLNTSPIRYLKKYRLEQAALSLRTSIKPIIDIAMECGFFDTSYFSKSFKELFKQTPSEYRNSKN